MVPRHVRHVRNGPEQDAARGDPGTRRSARGCGDQFRYASYTPGTTGPIPNQEMADFGRQWPAGYRPPALALSYPRLGRQRGGVELGNLPHITPSQSVQRFPLRHALVTIRQLTGRGVHAWAAP